MAITKSCLCNCKRHNGCQIQPSGFPSCPITGFSVFLLPAFINISVGLPMPGSVGGDPGIYSLTSLSLDNFNAAFSGAVGPRSYFPLATTPWRRWEFYWLGEALAVAWTVHYDDGMGGTSDTVTDTPTLAFYRTLGGAMTWRLPFSEDLELSSYGLTGNAVSVSIGAYRALTPNFGAASAVSRTDDCIASTSRDMTTQSILSVPGVDTGWNIITYGDPSGSLSTQLTFELGDIVVSVLATLPPVKMATISGTSSAVTYTAYDMGQVSSGGIDSHWLVETANGSGVYTSSYLVSDGAWVAPIGGRSWLGIDAGKSAWNGIRRFKSDFTVTTLPAGGVIYLDLASDNETSSITVNGNAISIPPIQAVNQFTTKTSIAIPASALTVGTNTIIIAVNDQGVIAGCLAEWVTSVDIDFTVRLPVRWTPSTPVTASVLTVPAMNWMQGAFYPGGGVAYPSGSAWIGRAWVDELGAYITVRIYPDFNQEYWGGNVHDNLMRTIGMGADVRLSGGNIDVYNYDDADPAVTRVFVKTTNPDALIDGTPLIASTSSIFASVQLSDYSYNATTAVAQALPDSFKVHLVGGGPLTVERDDAITWSGTANDTNGNPMIVTLRAEGAWWRVSITKSIAVTGGYATAVFCFSAPFDRYRPPSMLWFEGWSEDTGNVLRNSKQWLSYPFFLPFSSVDCHDTFIARLTDNGGGGATGGDIGSSVDILMTRVGDRSWTGSVGGYSLVIAPGTTPPRWTATLASPGGTFIWDTDGLLTCPPPELPAWIFGASPYPGGATMELVYGS